MNTRLDKSELWPEKLPNSFLNRVRETINYLKEENLSGRIADCGEDNPMKEFIQMRLKIDIDSIVWDFNYPSKIRKKYDIIFCFEVLEHIMNPLLFLNELKTILMKEGTIYLSTPYQIPTILKAKHHYHEIPSDRLMWLFYEARLNVCDVKKITIAGNWYNHLTGIRPIFRYFQKTRLYKLKNEERKN